MDTKERILQEALSLFSSRGYEAVSMRDIGAAVGIRESSIYKHYAGKQAVLDAVVAKAVKEIEWMMEAFKVPEPEKEASVSKYAEMELEEIAALCTRMLLEQRKNKILSQFRQLLTIEQYRNQELQEKWIELFIKRPLAYNEKVFDYLLRMDILWGTSPKSMALEFFAPFFLLQYQYQEDSEKLEDELKKHVIVFIREHRKGA